MDYFVERAIHALESEGPRLDANEAAFLERELTQLRATVFKEVVPDLKALRFLPIASDIAASAETFAYKVYKEIGEAKIGGNDTDDAPNIDISATEVTGKVFPVKDSYKWGLNEVREAIRLRIPLSTFRATAAKNAIDRGIDKMLAYGNTGAAGETNLVTMGLLNNTFVEGAAGARIKSLTDWTSATAVATILGEMNDMVEQLITDSSEAFAPDRMILPVDKFMVISQKRVGVENDKTILRSFLENNPYIKDVAPWYRCNGAFQSKGTAPTNGRAVVYRAQKDMLEGVVPLFFEQLPPQARNYAMVVNCQGRCGGVEVYQPSSMLYGDFA